MLPSPAPSPLSSSGASSTWHLERARRLRSSRTVMGDKLSRRESHSASRDAKHKSRSGHGPHSAHSSPRVRLPNPDGTLDEDDADLHVDIHSPVHTARYPLGEDDTSSSSDHLQVHLRPSPLMIGTPAHSAVDAIELSPPAAAAAATATAVTAAHSTSSSSHISPSSPIASASPHARRIKSHFASQGRENSYAIPTATTTTDVPHLALTPTSESAEAEAAHAAAQVEEAILFSPAYMLPTADEDGGESHTAHVPHASVAVNSVQKTVAAQSNVVHTAVATGHVKRTSNASSSSKSGSNAEEEFDPFVFIKNLPPLSHALRTCTVPVLPPPHATTPRILLALDLDETLVHCSIEPMKQFDLTFQVQFNSQEYCVYVKLRPHLQHFLRTVCEWFEVVVFTASQRIYADKLLSILDDTGSLIHHRLFRDSCVCVEGNFIKDLTVLGRDLDKTVIIDNSVQAIGYQLDNLIPIDSFFGECEQENDDELLKLLPFLNHIRRLDDVRPMLKQTFKLSEFVHSL